MSADATRELEKSLVDLADRSDGEAAAQLTRPGPARCAEVLLDEVVSRALLFQGPAVRTAVRV